ncbi:MBOAT family protein, partial [bacterium]|nr:MBOAT family protein [bacterium]
QIYFDFSGYSDMAIGAARLFGPRLPRNFDSPYEATSILDFWRRWHITLSEWFRDYVFMPLSRFFLTRTPLARAPSLAAALAYLTTFTLCGAWHGSSVGFVVWGAYHGLLLGGHRFYNDRLSRRREHPIHRWRRTRAFRLAACAFTFVLVTLGWVFFRAETLSRALVVLEGLFGLNARTPRGPRELAHLVVQCAAILLVLGATWLLPNTDELMRAETAPAGPEATPAPARTPIRWKPTLGWAALVAVLAVVSLLSTKETTSFIYFKF